MLYRRATNSQEHHHVSGQRMAARRAAAATGKAAAPLSSIPSIRGIGTGSLKLIRMIGGPARTGVTPLVLYLKLRGARNPWNLARHGGSLTLTMPPRISGNKCACGLLRVPACPQAYYPDHHKCRRFHLVKLNSHNPMDPFPTPFPTHHAVIFRFTRAGHGLLQARLLRHAKSLCSGCSRPDRSGGKA